MNHRLGKSIALFRVRYKTIMRKRYHSVYRATQHDYMYEFRALCEQGKRGSNLRSNLC